MLRNTLTLVLFAALIIFASCRKHRDAFVDGKILDQFSGLPISGAHVELHRFDPNNSSSWANHTNSIAQTTADASGYFHFDYVHNDRYDYAVFAEDPRYFDNYQSLQRLYSPGQTLNTSVHLLPKSWLRLRLFNNVPYDAADRITLLYNVYPGMTVDTTLTVMPEPGNDSAFVKWSVLKNFVTSFDSAKVYCPAYDTVDYTINY